MAYSLDFRKKILDVYLNGNDTNQEIADRFKISISTVKRIGQRFRETGKIELFLDKIGRTSKVNEEAKQFIKTIIANKPDMTLEEMCSSLKDNCQIEVTAQAIHYILKNLKMTYKKKIFM